MLQYKRLIVLFRARVFFRELLAQVVDGLLTLDPADYPRTLPRRALTPAFRERGRLLRGRGEPIAALHESGSMSAVYALVSNIRRVRRWRRGVEDYRY